MWTAGGTCVAGNDDACSLQSQVTFTASASETYKVWVHGFSSNEGSFTLTSSCTQGPAGPTPPPTTPPPTTPPPTLPPTPPPTPAPTNFPTNFPTAAPTLPGFCSDGTGRCSDATLHGTEDMTQCTCAGGGGRKLENRENKFVLKGNAPSARKRRLQQDAKVSQPLGTSLISIIYSELINYFISLSPFLAQQKPRWSAPNPCPCRSAHHSSAHPSSECYHTSSWCFFLFCLELTHDHDCSPRPLPLLSASAWQMPLQPRHRRHLLRPLLRVQFVNWTRRLSVAEHAWIQESPLTADVSRKIPKWDTHYRKGLKAPRERTKSDRNG